MRIYNKTKPLISLHIPKCGGTSLAHILKQWYGNKYYKHYFQQYQAKPPKHKLAPGICIHGHFNNEKGFGVMDYYPEIDQFITFVRDPLSIMISNYSFWKRKGRANQIRRGDLREGDVHDYKSINDFFVFRPISHLFKFMPFDLAFDNYKDILNKYFIYIGIVEDMQTSIDILADRLGFPAVEVVHLNKSEYEEAELSDAVKDEFIRNNALAFKVYNYIRQIYKNGR